MHKIISLALILMLIMGLAGCGGSKASDKAISVGKQALEIADQYLDETANADKAREKLSTLSEEMEYVDDLKQDDKNRAADFSVSTSLTVLSSSILNDSIKKSDDTYSKVLEARNDLAKHIGEKIKK